MTISFFDVELEVRVSIFLVKTHTDGKQNSINPWLYLKFYVSFQPRNNQPEACAQSGNTLYSSRNTYNSLSLYVRRVDSSTSRRSPTKSLLTLEGKGFKLGTGCYFGSLN